ncbi:MAG: VOC family protein [Allobaculum sp.]
MYEKALSDPKGIFYTYLELAPGQFIELFPSEEVNYTPNNYSHFPLLVEDIEVASNAMHDKGIMPDSAMSKGPSGTWQQWFHDPDGNKFEIMQYTADFWQVNGHKA